MSFFQSINVQSINRPWVFAAGLLALSATSAACAAGRPYDVTVTPCSDPNDVVCVSWDLQMAPGGGRTDGFRVDLHAGESVSGVVKPKSHRFTRTTLQPNPDLAIYIGDGFEPTTSHYTCRVDGIAPCAVTGRDALPTYFKVVALTDVPDASIRYFYSVAD